MTVASTSVIIERVLSAKKESKIAIFKRVNFSGQFLDAVFDNTFETKQRIKNKDLNYLGSFYGRKDIHIIELMENNVVE